MTVVGATVRLRAFEPADADAFYRWFNDREVTRYLSPTYPVSHAAALDRVAAGVPVTYGSAKFAVERCDSGELVGLAQLRDASPENRDAEVDLVIGERAAWGQGFGGDALRTLCRFGFEQMNLHRIHLYVFADHAAAIHLYETTGFVHEGRLRDAFWRGGRWHDFLLMGLLHNELLAAPASP